MGWSPFRKTGLTHSDDRSAGGFTLVTPVGAGATFLLDEAGRVVHSWFAPDFMPGYGYLLPGGTLLVRGQPKVAEHEIGAGHAAGSTDILLEIDRENRVRWRYEHPAFHHDMLRLPNGNTILITWASCDPGTAERVSGAMSLAEEKSQWADPEHVSFFMAGLGVGGRPRDLTGL